MPRRSMPRCSACDSETSLLLNGVLISPTCAAVRDKAARSFAEVTEALMRARQEYFDALAGHRGDPDGGKSQRSP
jgi:hypothetical protein